MKNFRVEYVTDICIMGFLTEARTPEEAIERTVGDFFVAGGWIDDIREIRVKGV